VVSTAKHDVGNRPNMADTLLCGKGGASQGGWQLGAVVTLASGLLSLPPNLEQLP